MKPVTAARSALVSALAGTTIVAIVLLGVMIWSAGGHDAFNGLVRVGSHGTSGWRLTLPTAALIVGPPILLLTFGTFFLIGRRAARPIDVARRRQLQFTADASHELRTPLTVIEGEATLALGRPRDPADYRKSLERVADESRRMRRLVDDLLWLARSETDPDRPPDTVLDLGEVTLAARERFQTVAAGKRLRILTADTTTRRPLLLAPSAWLERLLGVLMDNACRYTPAGGVVRVGARKDGDRVLLSVEDSGPGILPADAAHVFERFHRASPEPGGSGLGLAIAAKVVQETGGTWRVARSELGGALMEVSWRPCRDLPDTPTQPL